MNRSWILGGRIGHVAVLVLTFAALGVGTAYAYTPQTITVDGMNNEWLLDNRVEDDSGDTEFSTLDLTTVYITNDATTLYIGFGHNFMSWTQVQDGIKISTTNTSVTNDMWGHAIEYSGPHTPDYGAYVNYDNNWQEFRRWTGSAWSAPLRAGPGANGMMHTSDFHEIAFLLCELGDLSPGDSLWLEVIVTQDGATKGPLDASANDAVQLSTPSGTTFDTQTPIVLTTTIPYRILSAGDATPPTVLSACKSGTGTISVTFSEPVDIATGENIGNYVLGGTGSFIVDAQRRVDECNVVDLSLGFDVGAQSGLYSVTVTNVKDLAGNTIVANGVTNVAQFAIKDVLFRGIMTYFLQNFGSGADSFSVEGDYAPLTFTQTCDVMMADADVDSIYEALVQFCFGKPPDSTHASRLLEWKLDHNCGDFEPLGGNRQHLLTNATGPTDTLTVFWGDQDPTQFLSQAIDVLFRVDVAAVVSPGDTVAISGNTSPLAWGLPSAVTMRDDGMGGDAVASDNIYTRRLRFEIGSQKNVNYKFSIGSVAYECSLQADRNVFLNDAEFDTLGGALGELVLPVATWDFCSITTAAVAVEWQLKTGGSATPVDSIGVRGAAAPLSWDVDLALRDDGVPPDATGGDGTYTGRAVFPQGSPLNVEWKYTINDVFENGLNRSVFLNTELFDENNPIVFSDTLDVNVSVSTSPGFVARKVVLRQNEPNPFNPMTRIAFEVPVSGRYRLAVYNVLGRRVRELFDGVLPAGPSSIIWNGLDDNGRRVGSGVYVYVLDDASGGRASRKMMLLK